MVYAQGMIWRKVLLLSFMFPLLLFAKVELGVDRFFAEGKESLLKGKRIGIISNPTGVNGDLKLTYELFKERSKGFQIGGLFAPEHGFFGKDYAGDHVANGKTAEKIPIHSLHGETRRPTKEMLKGIDILIFDVQDIGCRSYTYLSTLCYVMEEAAKNKIEVFVLDRPNPQTGVIVDGPMLGSKFRSFIGYVNVPYCHGMTVGELAAFFNEEYKIGCKLKVFPMKGWKREMTFKETGLTWIPTSPHVPEPDTPFFYASTGIIGELDLINIGVGYTLPFKVVGAPWIDANKFADVLNQQKLTGVHFTPFHYKPFYGSLRNKECHGVKINITDPLKYRPLSVQYLLLGILKSLYPDKVVAALKKVSESKKKLFNQANGNQEIFDMLLKEKYISWKMIEFQKGDREKFLKVRAKYLRPEYQ